jgi:hypothetical protein
MKGQITGIIMTTADSGGRCRRTAMLMIPEEAVREAQKTGESKLWNNKKGAVPCHAVTRNSLFQES